MGTASAFAFAVGTASAFAFAVGTASAFAFAVRTASAFAFAVGTAFAFASSVGTAFVFASSVGTSMGLGLHSGLRSLMFHPNLLRPARVVSECLQLLIQLQLYQLLWPAPPRRLNQEATAYDQCRAVAFALTCSH